MKFSRFILLFLIIGNLSCKEKQYTSIKVEGKRIPIQKTIAPDTTIQNFIKPYSVHLNKTLDSALAYNPSNLNKNNGKLNTALGNLMADIVMEQANPILKSRTNREIDFVLLNHGGIRSNISKGKVSARTAYNIMPFENEIVVVEITGKKVNEMLKYLERAKTAHPVSGINISVDKNYRVINAKIQGKAINTNQNYLIATSDYLQQGGDNMKFFEDPVNVYKIDYKLRNSFIDYFKKVDTIKTKKDQRYIQKR
jgi:2',3'-cyclic-nucleotide 2'-phosphodiesterase (5'-nucleotidase family)